MFTEGRYCDSSRHMVDIKIKLVLPDGTHETGHDDGGVVRDWLSRF